MEYQRSDVSKLELGQCENELKDGSVSLTGHPVNRTQTGGVRAALFIHMLVSSDVLVSVGFAGNLLFYCLTYLQMSLAASINAVNNFMGVTFLLPIGWGYLADTLLGRYITILVASTVMFVGLLVLTLSASVKNWNPGECLLGPACQKASENQMATFYSGLFLSAIGSAGLKPCISSLGQDQFDETHPQEKKQGRHFFTSIFLNVNTTLVFATSLGYYIQTYKGYNWGWGSILVYFTLCLGGFLLGTPFLRHRKPEGSALTSVVQVLFVSLKNASKPVPSLEKLYEIDDDKALSRNIRKLAHTDRLRFLDKAAIFTPKNPLKTVAHRWEACTLTQVEELKSVVQILPIWGCTIVIYTVFAQLFSLTLEEAATLDRSLSKHLVIPPASTIFFLVISGFAFIPIYELCIVPILRKFTGHPKGLTNLKRIGVALFFSVIAMIIAALVEQKRVAIIKQQGSAIDFILLKSGQQQLPMTIFWLLPQYIFMGIVEFLIGVAQLDFFYSETPESMRSLATSMFYSSISIGYLLSNVLQEAVNNLTRKGGRGGWIELEGKFFTGGLTNYYYLLAVIMAIDLGIFVFCAHWYTPLVVNDRNLLSGGEDQGGHERELDTSSTIVPEQDKEANSTDENTVLI